MTKTLANNAPTAVHRSFLKSFFFVLRLIIINFLIFAALAELVCVIFVHLKSWPSSRPTYRLNYNLFWADINPSSEFGIARIAISTINWAVSASNTPPTAMARAT